MTVLTRKEAAERLKITTRTLASWLKRGLPYCKLGGAVRIAEADLDAWILSHRVAPGAKTKHQISFHAIRARAGASLTGAGMAN